MQNNTWDNIQSNLKTEKEKFYQIFKRFNKTRKLKKETIDQNTLIIIERYNAIRTIIITNYNDLSAEHKKSVIKTFQDTRDLLLRAFARQGVKIRVPSHISDTITTVEEETESDSETDTETDTDDTEKIRKMPVTIVEFVNFATKVVPEFNGEFSNLERFTDGIRLMESQIENTHLATAISVIKTKLTGTSRSLITNENTIDAIITRLRSTIHGESTDVILSKLMATKQGSKPITGYAKEMEELARSLATAYISEGIPNELADKYTTKAIVKSIVANATGAETKIVMRAAQFKNTNEVLEKLIDSGGEQSNGIMFHYGTGQNNNYNRSNNFNSQYYGPRQHNIQQRGRGNYRYKGGRGQRGCHANNNQSLNYRGNTHYQNYNNQSLGDARYHNFSPAGRRNGGPTNRGPTRGNRGGTAAIRLQAIMSGNEEASQGQEPLVDLGAAE